MSQVFEQTFGRINNQPLTIPGDGNAYLLQLKFPPLGFLTKLIVAQASGTGVAFTADVLTSNLGLTPGPINPSSLPAGWQLRRVMAQLVGTASTVAGVFMPMGQPFRNQDGADPVRSGVSQQALQQGQTSYTNAQRYLYVLLQPASGAGANAQWDVAVGCWNDVG